MDRKTHSWKNSFLSTTRKEVMIKVVLQSIPNYTANVFLLPKVMEGDQCFILKLLVEQQTRRKMCLLEETGKYGGE